jgi:hypothetical protein
MPSLPLERDRKSWQRGASRLEHLLPLQRCCKWFCRTTQAPFDQCLLPFCKPQALHVTICKDVRGTMFEQTYLRKVARKDLARVYFYTRQDLSVNSTDRVTLPKKASQRTSFSTSLSFDLDSVVYLPYFQSQDSAVWGMPNRVQAVTPRRGWLLSIGYSPL